MIITIDTDKETPEGLRKAAKVLLNLAEGDSPVLPVPVSLPSGHSNPVSRFVPPLPTPSQYAREPEEDAEEILHEAVEVERAVEEEDHEERKPAKPALPPEKPRVKPDLPGGVQIY